MVSTRRTKKIMKGGCTTRGGSTTGVAAEDQELLPNQLEQSPGVSLVSIVWVNKGLNDRYASSFINKGKIFQGDINYLGQNLFGSGKKPKKDCNQTCWFKAECWTSWQGTSHSGSRIQRRTTFERGKTTQTKSNRFKSCWVGEFIFLYENILLWIWTW